MLKAIREGDEEGLKAMIKDGKNLAEPNQEGWLPLHEAAYYGQLGCLKVLQQGEGQAAAGAGKATGQLASLSQRRRLVPTPPLLPSHQGSQDPRA